MTDTTPLGRRFRILWLGQAVSQLGDKMAYISIPLFVVYLTASGRIELGLVYTIESVPALVLGLFGGVLLDRVKVRPVMFIADIGRAAAFVYLAYVAAGDPPISEGITGAVLVVFAMAFLVGGMTNIFESALFALIPAIVTERQLTTANSRITATMTLGDALGPAVAGFLIALWRTNDPSLGFAVVFAINAATFMASALSLVLIGPVQTRAATDSSTGIMSDLLQGLRFVWGEARLRTSTIAIAVANLVTGFIEATFVILATEVVGVESDFELGVLFAMFGVGATVGAIAAPYVTKVIGLGRTMVLGISTFGLALTIFINGSMGFLGILYVFVAFAGLAAGNVAIATIRQVYTPPVMMGRVLAASRNIAYATLPIGAFLGTLLAEVTDSYDTMVRFSPLLIVIAVGSLIPTVIWRDTRGPIAGRRTTESTQL